MTTSRRQLWNACLGNLFEHYDTALFGFLSPFLAPLIFPDKEPIVALILTYAIIPLGMLSPSYWIAGIWLYWRCLWAKACSIFDISRHVFCLRMYCIQSYL